MVLLNMTMSMANSGKEGKSKSKLRHATLPVIKLYGASRQMSLTSVFPKIQCD
jgi:hypothetical protein